MRLASILLVSALFMCGSVFSTEGKQAYTVKDTTDDKRLLLSDDYSEERGINLAQLMKLDDEFSAIKQLVTEFAGLKVMKKEALDVFNIMKRGGMSTEQATYISNLFAKYMENPRLYH
ncbi:hypothetical protein P3T76_009902 [Phytophthora citrophthora]|uniref:RxLR effector protein n=1 Tax=Phytophthora citrophthora TaxID=4793 RepID=A0AAD9GEN1_9STRA|nr:hypothetical protein P3T76_009902 [Phytophthora citrophthora]